MDEDPQQRTETRHARPEAISSTKPSLPPITLSLATLLAVFVGGAAGTVCRYLLEAHHPVATGGFPWVTLVVNLSGLLGHRALGPAHRARRAAGTAARGPCSSSASSEDGPPTPR